jgi:prepilin-type N-terminal cleavage/methylation domain-containing protein
MRRTDGFSILELVVVLAIIAVLAGVLTPFVANLVEDARVMRAARESQTIAEAIQNFNKSTGKWPIFVSGASITTSSTYYEVLVGPGNLPAADANWLPTPPSKRGDLSSILELNTPGYGTNGMFAWRGPYLNGLQSDPWGNAYLVNAKALRFGAKEAGFVISAGSDGTITTTFTQNIGSGQPAVSISGDDIAARIR